MPQIICSVAALTVAAVFYSHRAFLVWHWQHRRLLRDRVAYMLWVMANTVR